MCNKINTVNMLFFLLVMLLLASCTNQLQFDSVVNSLRDRSTSDPIPSYGDVKKQINIFADKLENNESRHLNSEHITNGLLALAEKKFVEANESFQQALKFDPTNPFLHKLNALSYQMRGDEGDLEQYKLAEVGYQLATRMDPGDSKVYYFMGVLQFKQQNFRKAQEHFAAAIMKDPNQSEYYTGLAAASYYLGELGRAHANIKKAFALTPSNPATLQARGIIYASLGAFDRANSFSDILGDISKKRQKYLHRRINDWEDYYAQNNIKSDEQIKIQMAQNVDIFGVPKGGMFDSTDSSNADPLSKSEQSSSGTTDPLPTVTPVPSVVEAPMTPVKPDVDSEVKKNGSPVEIKKQLAEAKPKPPKKKINIPKMALVDVAIIRTEEVYKTSKGLNLLNGLNVFFLADQARSFLNPFGGQVVTTPTTNDAVTMQLGTAGAGLTYSLNIFSDNYDRNEVIARPTILVEHQKQSSFFSGGTLHIVIEGGVAGSGAMEPLPTGVKLKVTPKFLDSETLGLSVYAERTFLEASLSQVSDTITGTSFATTTKTSIAANLTLRYDETMVISGLSDQEKEVLDDKVPFIGDLPGIQYLFRKQTKTSAKKTIIILLTPRRAGLTDHRGGSIADNTKPASGEVDKLEKNTDWMKPASNLKAYVQHLSKYEFFNHYRKGDMRLDNWAGEKTIKDAIFRTLDYLYIYYDFEKNG
jgi:Flp pilus assembly protein TadD